MSDPRVVLPTAPTFPPIMVRPPKSAPNVSLSAQKMQIAPTKVPYIQTLHTAPLTPRVFPTTSPTFQPTAWLARVDPTPQCPTMTPTAKPLTVIQGWSLQKNLPSGLLIPSPTVIAPALLNHSIYCPRTMNPYPAAHAQSKAFPTCPMPRSIPPLPLVANYQPILSPSGPFPYTTPNLVKLLSITNSAVTLVSRITGTSLTQMKWGTSTR